ncbi:LOW QUALITY PROTEIN: uncharacterized protein ACR2FA_005495 [Aphomia sociella]
MRALLGSAACAAFLLICPTTLVLCHKESGYHPEDGSYLDDAVDVRLECPSDRFIRTRQTCHDENGADIQCIRIQCCDTHVFIAGRCIPKALDPCSLQLCEQACEVRGNRVWCTCHQGFEFHPNNYERKTQPYCVDVDECENHNGGCEQRCVNDPGAFHCECLPPMILSSDGKNCEHPTPIAIQRPLPLIRASSRCYAPCDTVSWLTRKMKQLTDQLHATQSALKKIMDNPALKGEGSTYAYKMLDSTAPLEGGYCRCERGPRGPPGATGRDGPKGAAGARARGPRGPEGSLDLMLLLLADMRHDINNLEARVYNKGELPERFNLQKAWRHQRKQEKREREGRTEQALEAYTAPPLEGAMYDPVYISPQGLTGEIPRESTTDWSLVKGDTEPSDLPMMLTEDMSGMDEKLRQFYILANITSSGEEEEQTSDDGDDNDYNNY